MKCWKTAEISQNSKKTLKGSKECKFRERKISEKLTKDNGETGQLFSRKYVKEHTYFNANYDTNIFNDGGNNESRCAS